MFMTMHVYTDESFATAMSDFLVGTTRWQSGKRKMVRLARHELASGQDGRRLTPPSNAIPASGALNVGMEAFRSVCLLGVFAACNVLAADDSTNLGRVESFSVGCTGRSADTASWQPLRKNEPVLAGHQLRCPVGGAVLLRLPGSGAQNQYDFKKTTPVVTVPHAPSNSAEPGIYRGGVQAKNLQPERPSDGESLAEQKMLAQATRFTQAKIVALEEGAMTGAMAGALVGSSSYKRHQASGSVLQRAIVGSSVDETDGYVTAKRAEAQLDETRAQRAVLADAEADLEGLRALSESVDAVVSAGRNRLYQLQIDMEAGQLGSKEASARLARESQNIDTIQFAKNKAHQTLGVYREALMRLGAPADLVDALALKVQLANQSLSSIQAQKEAYKVALDRAREVKPTRVPVSSP